MHSKNTSKSHAAGSFHLLTLSSTSGERLFPHINDMTYFVGLLKRTLSYRECQERQLPFAQHINLLAYSLSNSDVRLLFYTTSEEVLRSLDQTLVLDYIHYLTKQGTLKDLPFNSPFSWNSIATEQDALQVSLDMHAPTFNSINTSRSSIGFYLQDRRGDWMRIWQITKQYNNDAVAYESMLKGFVLKKDALASSFLET